MYSDTNVVGFFWFFFYSFALLFLDILAFTVVVVVVVTQKALDLKKGMCFLNEFSILHVVIISLHKITLRSVIMPAMGFVKKNLSVYIFIIVRPSTIHVLEHVPHYVL